MIYWEPADTGRTIGRCRSRDHSETELTGNNIYKVLICFENSMP